VRDVGMTRFVKILPCIGRTVSSRWPTTVLHLRIWDRRRGVRPPRPELKVPWYRSGSAHLKGVPCGRLAASPFMRVVVLAR